MKQNHFITYDIHFTKVHLGLVFVPFFIFSFLLVETVNIVIVNM